MSEATPEMIYLSRTAVALATCTLDAFYKSNLHAWVQDSWWSPSFLCIKRNLLEQGILSFVASSLAFVLPVTLSRNTQGPTDMHGDRRS